MSIGKMRYHVFCSARLQWKGTKLEPFKRVRAMGHAEQECRRLARENPEAIVFAIGPQGYRYVVFDAPGADNYHTVSSGGSVIGVGR